MFKLAALTVAAGMFTACIVQAEEAIEFDIIYPLNQELFQLSDRAFLTQDNKGGFEVLQGRMEGGSARCIGSGFVFRDGASTITGICIFGDAGDTFTIAWKAGEKGAANTWEVVAGDGIYRGMTGSGIATTDVEVTYKALPLRKTHLIGTVDIPNL